MLTIDHDKRWSWMNGGMKQIIVKINNKEEIVLLFYLF